MCDHCEIPHASMNGVISINTWAALMGLSGEREREGKELFCGKNWRGEVGILPDDVSLLNSQE